MRVKIYSTYLQSQDFNDMNDFQSKRGKVPDYNKWGNPKDGNPTPTAETYVGVAGPRWKFLRSSAIWESLILKDRFIKETMDDGDDDDDDNGGASGMFCNRYSPIGTVTETATENSTLRDRLNIKQSQKFMGICADNLEDLWAILAYRYYKNDVCAIGRVIEIIQQQQNDMNDPYIILDEVLEIWFGGSRGSAEFGGAATYAPMDTGESKKVASVQLASPQNITDGHNFILCQATMNNWALEIWVPSNWVHFAKYKNLNDAYTEYKNGNFDEFKELSSMKRDDQRYICLGMWELAHRISLPHVSQ